MGDVENIVLGAINYLMDKDRDDSERAAKLSADKQVNKMLKEEVKAKREEEEQRKEERWASERDSEAEERRYERSDGGSSYGSESTGSNYDSWSTESYGSGCSDGGRRATYEELPAIEEERRKSSDRYGHSEFVPPLRPPPAGQRR